MYKIIYLFLFTLFLDTGNIFCLEKKMPEFIWKSKFKSSTYKSTLSVVQSYCNENVFLFSHYAGQNTGDILPMNMGVFTDNFKTSLKIDYSFWDIRNTFRNVGWFEKDDKILLYTFKAFAALRVLPEVFHFSKDGRYLGKFMDSTNKTLNFPLFNHFIDKNGFLHFIEYNNTNKTFNKIQFNEYSEIINEFIVETELIDYDLSNFRFRYAVGTSDNGFIMRFANYLNTRDYSLLVKFNNDGKYLWTKRVDHQFGRIYDDDFFTLLEPSNEEGFVHYSYTTKLPVNENDTLLQQTFYKIRESDGEIVYSKTIDDISKNNQFWSLLHLKTIYNGSVIVTVSRLAVEEELHPDYPLESTNGRYIDINFYDTEYNLLENYTIPEGDYYVVDVISSTNNKLLIVYRTWADFETYHYGEIKTNRFTNIEESITLSNDTFIFPNPAQDFINIKSEQNIVRIEIVNYLGNTVLSVEDFYIDKFNISSLQNGVYLLKMFTVAGNILTQKLMVTDN